MIIFKIQVLKFEDYDTRRKEELARSRFMVTIPDEPPNADIVSTMEWECGLEQSGILNMLLCHILVVVPQSECMSSSFWYASMEATSGWTSRMR